jgi:hypothetical protein
VGDAPRIDEPLDARHLLDLVADRLAILERERDALADLDPAGRFVLDHTLAVVGTDRLVAGDVEDVRQLEGHAGSPSASVGAP